MATHVYVVVSGPPGSGKSTLALALARRLSYPLLGKDTIKEALLDALGASEVDDSRRLGAASMSVLLAIAAENGYGVLEGTWRASLATAELRDLAAPVIEVFCACDPVLARERYARRAAVRHAGHFDATRVVDDDLWTGETAVPVDGGWPVIRVDTARAVDTDDLYRRIVAFTAPGDS
jgi:predicted kinase